MVGYFAPEEKITVIAELGFQGVAREEYSRAEAGHHNLTLMPHVTPGAGQKGPSDWARALVQPLSAGASAAILN